MITLDNLRPTRTGIAMPRPLLASIANLSEQRLRTLELRKSEPWFDEAAVLARILNVEIADLVNASGTLTVSAAGPTSGGLRLPSCGPCNDRDPELWRSGARIPLSLAVRVADRFGLSKVDDLTATATARQIWDVVGANDRHPEHAGICPWCIADIAMGDPHRDTCLPNNLWSPAVGIVEAIDAPLGPLPKKRGRVPGIPARGLKAHRIAANKIQKEVADHLGLNVNYYARLERGSLPLGLDHADKLAAYYDVGREELYVQPEPSP